FADNSKESYLMIIDDFMTEKDPKNLKKLSDYFIFGRKKNITMCFLAQSYYGTIKLIRDQVNYVMLLSIKSNRDLNRIISEYSIPNVTESQVNNMFDYCTDK
ncbi:hypothetical protein B484DRAFT_310431, partial [Ochromonadaceae sp. CCMP2298]